jgi:glycosyltransferase involved in cell wall biosynthesis
MEGRHKVRTYLKQQNIKLCISFDILANILLILSAPHNVVRIISERNAPKQTEISTASKILRFLTYRNCDYCVFQTEEAKACYSRQIQNKGIVIPNPVKQELSFIRREDRKNEIIAIGRLERQKNYDAMIAGFEKFYRRHPEYCLKIFGDGSEKERLAELIRQKKLENAVLLCGTNQDVHNQMSCADMYLMTSDYEGIPNSLLEAMAMGYAAVACDCPAGGCRLLIENDYNGILLSGNKPDMIADALARLAEDASLRRRLGENAKKVRETFSMNRIGGMWLQLVTMGEEIR